MRIIYVAKHGPHDNCDEEAIFHALIQLGHDVVRIRQERGDAACYKDGDFCLFHKWEDVAAIRRLKIPAVFWYFDLLSSPEREFDLRLRRRREWLHAVIPSCLVGFLTDGDMAAISDKLVWLPQGADERMVGRGTLREKGAPPILFTGNLAGSGQARQEHLHHLRLKWGSLFEIYGAAGERYRVHGRKLADRIHSADVIVAPVGPSTNRYWSNRVYLTLGFAGLLIHPRCEGLTYHYAGGREIIYYDSVDDCDDAIEAALAMLPEQRHAISEAGYDRTINEHLYRHRCEKLVAEVKARLG